MTQLDLLEYGRTLRDSGMALAEASQALKDPTWSVDAYAAIERVARRQAEVHRNDITGLVREPTSPNAWGSVWQRAIRDGIIEHSGRVKPCIDPSKHAHSSPVYASLIFRKAQS